MIEGLWTGEWEWESESLEIENLGAGVFYFREGKVYGGDARYFYHGDYRLEEKAIKGVLEFVHYDGEAMELLGGFDEGQISFSGDFEEPHMTLEAQIGFPAILNFKARLTKRGEV